MTPRTALGALVSIVVLMLGAAACSSGGGTSTGTTAPASTVAQAGPRAGACLEPMTEAVADGFQLPAIVPCSAPHGGEIVAVHTLDAPKDAPYPASGTTIVGANDTVGNCLGTQDKPGEFGRFVGDGALQVPDALQKSTGVSQAWAISGLQSAMFVPGTAAWAGGARWFACAAVLNNSLDTPSSYTGSARDVLGKLGKIPEAFTWCKNQPDAKTPGNFQSVSCAESHNYEQLASFQAGSPTAKFPGDQTLDQMGATLCPPLASQATADRTANLPSTLGLSWSYPQEGDWANGGRIVRCFLTSTAGSTTGSFAAGTAKTG